VAHYRIVPELIVIAEILDAELRAACVALAA